MHNVADSIVVSLLECRQFVVGSAAPALPAKHTMQADNAMQSEGTHSIIAVAKVCNKTEHKH